MLTTCPFKRPQGDGPFKIPMPCGAYLKSRDEGPDEVLYCPACGYEWTLDGKEF
jgi:hypothetical protein